MAQNAKLKFTQFIQREFQPKNLIPTVTAALVTGVIAVSNTIAFGAMIFSGELSAYLPAGIGIALFTGMVMAIVVSILSSAPGITAFPQSATIPILALLVSQIAANMPITATVGQLFSTVVTAIAFATILTGLVFLTFGRFKLGKLIRFMPYPVFGGFLAGLGWLLVKSSFRVMGSLPDSLTSFMEIFAPETLLRWLPGLLLAIVLFVVQRKIKHFSAIPITLLAGFTLFFVVTWVAHISLDTLMANNWLLGPFPDGGLWQRPTLSILKNTNWTIIFGQSGTLVTLIFTSLIGVLFNCSGVEIAVKADIDLDQDLQAAGLANLLSGVGGGMVGYQSAGLSILPQKIGAKSRLVGILAGLLFGITLIFGASLLENLPKMVIGALLLFLGFSLLYRWVIEAEKVLPRYDYLILLLILFIIAVFGLLQGVIVGILATIALFAFNYSRVDVVRNRLTGSSYKSNVERTPYHQQFLKEKGEQLLILRLQGFIFFGTAFGLLEDVRQRFENPELPPLKYIVLDFRLVPGIDSSALDSFKRMAHLAQSHQATVLMANLESNIEEQLIASDMLTPDSKTVRVFADIDRAVEWCENKILNDEDITLIMRPELRAQLMPYFENAEDVDTFLGYMEKKEIAAGTCLIQQSDPASGVYFIERGQMSVVLFLSDHETIRLRTIGAGNIIGELGMYLHQPATASVIAGLDSVVYYLSNDAIAQMGKNDPEIAAAFHKYLATIVSKRLVDTHNTVQALLD